MVRYTARRSTVSTAFAVVPAPPLGRGRRRRRLLFVARVAPHGIMGRQVGDDALSQGQRAVGFGERKVLGNNAILTPATPWGGGMNPTARRSLSTTTIV